MVIKKSKDQLLHKLKAEGLRFREFSLVHEGRYQVADADWNYKDIPHLHHVHQLAEAFPSYVDDEKIASIVLQKVLGLQIPLSVFIYENSPRSQLYYTSSFFFLLIIESVYEDIGENRTRVTTTYAIGTSKLLKWTFPLLRWIITRNYRDLMSTDIPMRERRGELRSWGYDLYNDTPTYSYIKSVNLTVDDVIAPVLLADNLTENLTIDRCLPTDGEFLWGRDDAWGLRLIRQGAEVKIYPRMCHHQGASLDGQPCQQGKIKCPWHGKLFSPLLTLALHASGMQHHTSKYHQLVYQQGNLCITMLHPSMSTLTADDLVVVE